jgi:hypothetical protein
MLKKKNSALNQQYHYTWPTTLGFPKILTEQVDSVWPHQRNVFEIPHWNPAWCTGYSDQGF